MPRNLLKWLELLRTDGPWDPVAGHFRHGFQAVTTLLPGVEWLGADSRVTRVVKLRFPPDRAVQRVLSGSVE